MMETQELFAASRQQPSDLPSSSSPPMEQHREVFEENRNDQEPDAIYGKHYPYRLFNYTNTRRGASQSQEESNIWDDIWDIHHRATEGRDEAEDGRNQRFSWMEDGGDDGTLVVDISSFVSVFSFGWLVGSSHACFLTCLLSFLDSYLYIVVVHKKLLQRRHVWKLQKERALLAATGRAVATSPIHKRLSSSPSVKVTTSAGASPCAFHTERRPEHSPIRSRQSGVAWCTTDVSTNGNVKPRLTCESECKQYAAFHKEHSNYPQISPVRYTKRRKLF